MPHQPGHPDHQQLAAFQAGELNRRERARLEEHLGACADCAGLLAGAEQARQLLAAVPLEPELPPGLHERLEAAVRRELATDRHRRAPAPVVLPASAPAWYRRRGALGLLGAAAVLLLLVALVPQLHLGGSPKRASTAAGSVAQPANGAASQGGGAAGSSAQALAAIMAPGGFSAQDLRARLASDPNVRAAFSAAARSAVPVPSTLNPGHSSQPQAGAATATAPPAGALAGPAGDTSLTMRAACAAAATKLAPGSRPALLVRTVYQGKPATVLVTVAPGSGGGTVPAILWYFADGTCGGQPIHQEATTVTLP